MSSKEPYDGQPGDEIIFETRIFDVVRRFQSCPNGEKQERFVVRNRGAVALLPVLDDGSVVLIRQYRAPTAGYIYEIPAGTREPGEEPIITAARELVEETGYRAGKIVPLYSFYSSPGIFQEKLHLFLATELTPGPTALESGEDITTVIKTKEEIAEMLRKGEIEDAKTILALLTLLR